MRARFLPSTSTFTVPSGSRSSCTTVPSVPTLVDVVLGRVVGLRVLLRREEDDLLLVHRLFERADRLLPPDEERDHHVREDDDVAQRQQRNAQAAARVVAAGILLVLVVSKEHRSPADLAQRGLGRLLVEDDRLLAAW